MLSRKFASNIGENENSNQSLRDAINKAKKELSVMKNNLGNEAINKIDDFFIQEDSKIFITRAIPLRLT